MDIILAAKKVFDKEIKALEITRDSLGFAFESIIEEIINCKGKVIITGMGKPGHIAKKIAATFSSLGTPSFYLNPAEAMHGDLGMVSSQDVVVIISYSGESSEIVGIISAIKLIGAKVISLTGNGESTLAKYSDIVQVFPKFHEACHLGLAPTSSTTAELCYGDALAIVASELYGFKDTDFGKYHPAGALGKRLIYKVEDIMAVGDSNAIVDIDSKLYEVITEFTLKKLGVVTVIDSNGNIKGIITTGDLGRQLKAGVNIYNKNVSEVITETPKIIGKDRLAVEALNIMKKNNIYAMPVVYDNKPIGTITVQKILNAGIVE